eukprot:6207985-Pleurochrysis_carterae.AAC.4
MHRRRRQVRLVQLGTAGKASADGIRSATEKAHNQRTYPLGASASFAAQHCESSAMTGCMLTTFPSERISPTAKPCEPSHAHPPPPPTSQLELGAIDSERAAPDSKLPVAWRWPPTSRAANATRYTPRVQGMFGSAYYRDESENVGC